MSFEKLDVVEDFELGKLLGRGSEWEIQSWARVGRRPRRWQVQNLGSGTEGHIGTVAGI